MSDELFASLSGDDGGDGSILSPLRSLSEAARRLRESSLPVTLAAFTGVADGPVALLQWNTQAETNNAGFHVEQFASSQWEARLFVAGSGTTAEVNHYEARIYPLPPGIYQFRLRQVDFDGQTSYSSVVEVEISTSGSVAVMPNPAREFVQVLGVVEGESVVLYDLSGRRVLQHRAEGPQIRLNVASLSRGTYLLRAGTHTQALTLL